MVEPKELPQLFLKALNSGDVDAVVSLHEAEGVIAIDGIRSCPGTKLRLGSERSRGENLFPLSGAR